MTTAEEPRREDSLVSFTDPIAYPPPGPTKRLLAAIIDCLDEQYPYWRLAPEWLPAGLRIEMHPLVRHVLMQDPDNMHLSYPFAEQPDPFPVPTKVTTDVAARHWRLVIVTEDVLIGGTLAP